MWTICRLHLHRPDLTAAVVRAGIALREAEALVDHFAAVQARCVQERRAATLQGAAVRWAFDAACARYHARQAEVRDALAEWPGQERLTV